MLKNTDFLVATEAGGGSLQALERTREVLRAAMQEVESAIEDSHGPHADFPVASRSCLTGAIESKDISGHPVIDFDIFLQSTEIGVVFLDAKLNITSFTTLAADLFHLVKEDTGRHIGTFRSPFMDVEPELILQAALEQHSFVEVEAENRDGSSWLIRALSNPDADGAILTLINISRMRDAEAAARQSSLMLARIRETTKAFFIKINAETGQIVQELGLGEYTGETDRELPADIDFTLNHPDDRDQLIAASREFQDEGSIELVARLWHSRSKSYRYIRYTSSMDEHYRYVVGVDVHDLVLAQQESEERGSILDAILKASPALVSYVDKNEQYRYVNETYQRKFGLAPDDVIGKSVADLLPENVYKAAKTHIDAALRGERQEFINEGFDQNGDPQLLSVIFQPRVGKNGDVDGFAVNVLDVTRFYAHADEIRSIDHLLVVASRQAGFAIVLVDVVTGKIEFANPAALMRMGLPKDVPLPHETVVSRLTPEWGANRWRGWLDAIEVGEDQFILDINVFRDQSTSGKADLVATMMEHGGRKKALVRIVENQERQQVLQDLQERSRLLALSNRDLEQFASVIAHDLRAPLRHITQFSDFLEQSLDERVTDSEREFLSEISSSTQVLSCMVDSLLDYARMGRTVKPFETVDLASCIEKVTVFLSADIAETGTQIDIGELPMLKGNADLITRLFQNLISNAIKYRCEDSSPHIRINASAANGVTRIRVEDNGIGIRPEYAKNIFDLFRRLHSDSEYPGLGVGLATCRRICELHGGSIELDTDYSRGSRFTIILPLMGEARTEK